MERDPRFLEPDRTYDTDIGVQDAKFALTGIGIVIAIAILLMIFS